MSNESEQAKQAAEKIAYLGATGFAKKCEIIQQAIDAALAEQQPLDCGDYWSEDPLYDLKTWKYEVENNNTRRGYWEWVKACADDAEHDQKSS